MAFKHINQFYRKKSKSKYNNKKIKDSEGNVFDSKKEYERWRTLCILQEKGFIEKLNRQVPFGLIPSYKGIQLGIKYKADFVYYDNGKMIVEDAKGMRTDVYTIKKKLMYHIHKIKIKEV